jgi:hypothetical protein
VNSQLQAPAIFSKMKDLQLLGMHRSQSVPYGKLKTFLRLPGIET